MTTHASPPTLDALVTATSGGNHAAALNIVQAWGRLVPPEALPLAAEVHIHHGQWREAARLLNRLIDPDPAAVLRQRLARNMSAVQQHRPALLEKLNTVQNPGRFQVAQLASGQGTLVDTAATPPTILSPEGNPGKGVEYALKTLGSPTPGGAVTLVSIGDGYVLQHLAANPPSMMLTMQQCVHVVEPDVDLLLAAFQLHDYSGPRGPIAQPRFQFHIGPDWAPQLEAALTNDPLLPRPTTRLLLRSGIGFDTTISAIFDRLARRRAELTGDLEAHYAAVKRDDLASKFRLRGNCLIITSRFTTVLQYSARDAATALESLGWRVELLIEPDDHYWISEDALVQTLHRTRPDMVFVIDHLRREFPGKFPANLPFVCWVQDQLPNLTNSAAGSSITPRDFVLTPVAPMYATAFNYPTRQLIDLPQLTNPPVLPATWEAQGEDLSYVSNAPPPIEQVIATTIEAAAKSAAGPVVERCCRKLVELYDRGENVPTLWRMGQLIDQAAREIGVPLEPATRTTLVNHLTHPLNNALYRRQALRWVTAAARNNGWTFGLYGRGWDAHAEFAPFAKGVVDYGPPLQQLNRNTKINLQIIPSLCLHPRMIDGLVAGGFFLVRQHPADVLLPQVARFLVAHPTATAADVLHELPGAVCFSELGQPIDIAAWVRSVQRCGLLDETGEAAPHLAEVMFTDEASFTQRVSRFLAAPQERTRIAADQRASVAGRLSYRAGLERVVRTIGDLIAAEPER